MKVLVTGSEGYIGSLLTHLLIKRGHEVCGLDTGYYRDGWLYSEASSWVTFPVTKNKDIRRVCKEDLDGFDAIVHLAELSNDPLGQNDPENTFDINHKGTLHIAKLAKECRISRFVYTSSCSVYGASAKSSEEMLDENAPMDPQTAYANCKVLVERDLKDLADDSFSPTFLRNSTAYGASPRMRFDIVLNNLAGYAHTINKIVMTSDGSPWRPLVHVLDICKAIYLTLEAPKEAIHNEAFNVGDNADNYQVKEIAEIVSNTFPDCELTIGDSIGDNRSYKVSFDKINSQLPNFKCEWNAEKGAKQLYEVFSRIDMKESDFQFRAFTRLKQLEYLIRTKQVDSKFFWSV